ncbi:MAG: GNAT family N-acetyltransferase [Blastocatellia bacterium]
MAVSQHQMNAGATTKFSRDLKLADGTVLHLRLLRPDDRHELKRLFARCSPESIRFRFLHQVKALTEEALDHLTNVDGARHIALAVTYRHHIIAVGRYQVQADRLEVAEVSFLVEDAWQKRGIGTQLLNMLVELAHAHGITRFSADVLTDNILMLSVFRKAGYALCSSTSYGVTHLEFPITEQAEENTTARPAA